MTTPFVYPSLILQPFANAGSKNTIPNTSNPTPGGASLTDGFPALTRTPIQSGGVPPSGLDFNGIFNLITQHSVWLMGGNAFKFDAAIATFTGGYKLGSVLQSNDQLSMYISLVDNNTIDFNSSPSSIGVQWGVYGGAAASNLATTISTTGGSTSLTTTQAVANIIIVTGVLVSNATLTFPSVMRSWRVVNNTTGAFSLFVKAASGATLTCTQGHTNTVFYDGTQLTFPDWDTSLDSPTFRGIPRAPTAAPSNNSTQISTTAYVDAAAAAIVVNVSAQYVSGAMTAGSTGDLWTDTSAGPFTIALPDPPIGKNILTFRDIFGTWSANNLTINPGTKTILGTAASLVANASGRTFGMWYDSVSVTWKLI